MSIVVQKYGGSSVADVDRLRHVAGRVMRTRAGRPRRCRRRLGDGRHDRRAPVDGQAGVAESRPARARHAAVGRRAHLDGAAVDGDPRLGGDAISFTGSQSGIITNDRHVDARIIEVRPFRVLDELAAAGSSSSPATRACRIARK
jgi:aspartate kinase